jgi:tol-pal system protein YbgF
MRLESAGIRALCAVAMTVAVAAGPAMAQTRQSNAPAVVAPAPPPNLLQDRVETLETALAQATADNERLQLELRRSQQEIERLQRIISDMAAAQDALDTVQAERQQMSQSAPPPPPPGAPGTLGTLPVSALPPEDPADAYARARELLFNNQLPAAQAAFEDFLQRYPDATDAPEAQYWLAFTLLGQNEYTQAAAGFVTYLQTYGSDQSPRGRGPDALVRLGIALAGAGRTEQACAAFRDLARRYPNAPRSTRDLADQQSRRNACPA